MTGPTSLTPLRQTTRGGCIGFRCNGCVGDASAASPPNAWWRPYPKHIWAYDFVEDSLADGTPLRILTVMDEFTREGLALDVAVTACAERVIGVLTRLVG